jgi:apolipoprotein N-acyltransferase
VINPHGQTQWLSDLNAYQTYLAPIYRRQTQTLYVRWGNLPILIASGLGLGSVIVSQFTDC